MVNMNDIPAWEYKAERRLKDSLAWTYAYSNGYRKPRYPVPAIPLEVDWYPDPLIIISETMPVSEADLKDERYWRGGWRSDGLYDEDFT